MLEIVLQSCGCQLYKKADVVYRTPLEAKAVYPSDWMRKFN